MRSVSCGVIPATGSSTSSSSGSCMSSMPISSHCFCPWDSVPASAARCAGQPDDLEDVVDVIALGGCQAGDERLPERLVAPERELEILEHRQLLEHGRLLKLAADARLCNLGLGERQEIDVLARTTPCPDPAASCP